MIVLIIIYLLNLIDCFQTMYAIQLFGIGVEANPIARFMFEHNCALVLKLVLVLIALVVMGVVIRADKRFIWAPYCLLVFYTYIVVRNFIVLDQMGALQIGEKLMTTISIVCAVITTISALACGALCAYYKHLKKK